jgi:hypothetical protein
MSGIPKSADAADHWRAHLKAWRESGLNQTRYCAENDLKPFNFSYWKKKLEPEPGGGFVELQTPLQLTPPRAALLEVRISESFELSLNLRLPGTILGRLFGGHVSGR